MPFLTDTNWPTGLHAIFNVCRQQQQELEYRYHGAYNKLLEYCFGPSDSFEFFISTNTSDNPTGKVSFIQPLVVFDAHHHPVLLVNINDDSWAHSPELRFRADVQMFQQFYYIIDRRRDLSLPHLWGLSLLGTSLRIYALDTASGKNMVKFTGRPSPNHVLPHDFLEGAWDIDILSQEGFNKMKEIVEYIYHGQYCQHCD